MKIAFRHVLLILLPFFLAVNVNLAFAQSCDNCVKLEKALARFTLRKAALKKLFKKNENYLKKLGKADTSRQIKVNSNMFLITTELETIENNEQRVVDFWKRFACSKCSHP